MSGFLERLGARAIGRAAIVPRAAALFETPAAAPVAAPVTPDLVRIAHAAEAASVRRASARRTGGETPSREPRGPRDASAPESETDFIAAVRRPDTEPDIQRSSAVAPRAVDRGAEPNAPRAASLSDPGQPALPATDVRVARPAAATPALVSAQALPISRRATRARSTVAAPAQAAEAVEPVRVTIGRVEVRAVFDQAPARAPARAAPPSPSLDEYLRKRGRS